MTTAVRTTTNLPVGGADPALEEAAHLTWPCQVFSRSWRTGPGFVFVTCERAQAYVARWTAGDRWRTRRTLYVCDVHGAQFAETHGLGAGTPVAAAQPARIPAVAAVAAQPTVAATDPFADESPVSDADAPYGRVRGRA